MAAARGAGLSCYFLLFAKCMALRALEERYNYVSIPSLSLSHCAAEEIHSEYRYYCLLLSACCAATHLGLQNKSIIQELSASSHWQGN